MYQVKIHSDPSTADEDRTYFTHRCAGLLDDPCTGSAHFSTAPDMNSVNVPGGFLNINLRSSLLSEWSKTTGVGASLKWKVRR
jgi:hypothetical protein